MAGESSLIKSLLQNLSKQRPDAMKRARSMGFDTRNVYFHGTDQPIEQFHPEIYVAKDPEIAEVYARKREYEPVQLDLFKPHPSPNIVPMFAKKGAAELTNPMAGYYKVFDPRHLRSVFAEFNPEHAESVDIMKSHGGSAKSPAWTRKEGKNPEGGLNEKGRASLRAAGHDIKRPQPEGGSRKDSFCARMKGMKAKLTSSETANDPDSRINKSLRKWKCADGGALDIARQYKAGGGEIYLLKQRLAEIAEEGRKKKNLRTKTPSSTSPTTPYGTSPATPNMSKDLYEKGNLGEDNYALAKGGAAKAASRIARKYRALGGSSTELVEGQNPAFAAANPVPINAGAQSVPTAQPAAVSPAYMPSQAMATSAPAAGPSNDVNNLFKTYLGRDADPNGLEYYSGLLNSGAMTLKDITNDITNSPEGRSYASRQPQYSLHNYGDYSDQYANATNSPEQTVKTIFKDVLGRDVDEGGLKYYSDMIRQGVSPSDIYNDVSGSEEAYANETIKGYFQDILGREPDQGGLDYYKGQLLSGRPPEEIKNEFMGSKEANSYNNMAFIKDEYAGLLGREPTQEELSKALNDLSSGKVTYEDFDNNLSNSEASQLYQASNFEPYDVASRKGVAPPKQSRTAFQYSKSVPRSSEELNNIFAPIEQKYGLSPGSMIGKMGLESTWGQNPKAYKTNANYKGPFQLSKTIIDKYNVKNPFDLKEAAEAAAQYERDNAKEFEQKVGRKPLPHEGYNMHQQGLTGYSTLAKNPNIKAVDALKKIMKPGTASSSIRQNMPPSLQGKVSYKDVTAQEFMDGWKVEFDKKLAGPDGKGQTPVVAGDRGTTPQEDNSYLNEPFQPGSPSTGDEISQQEFLQNQGIGGDLVASGTTMFPITDISGGGYQDPGVFGGNYTDATSGAIAPSVPHTVTHNPVTHTPVIHTGGSHTSTGGGGSFSVGYAPDAGSYGGHHASGHGAVDPYFGHAGSTYYDPHYGHGVGGASSDWEWDYARKSGGRINKDTGGAVKNAMDVARAYKKGGPVWDKPRPKSLGKPTPLSSDQKSSAKAMAKAAGRPYPNLVDNMRAAKKD